MSDKFVRSINGYEIADEQARAEIEEITAGNFDNITVGNDLEVNGKGIFNDIVNFKENLYLDNKKYLYGRDTGDNPLLIAGVQEENHILLGYGGWNAAVGETSIMGNDVKVSAKGGNNINLLTGGVSIPENSDLNNYITIGNYTCANSTIAKTLSNTPYTGAGFALKVGNVYNNNLTQNSPNIYQELITPYGDSYTRRLYNGTWYDWHMVLSTRNIENYITAEGDSGDWHYRKWNNGWAECWATINKSSVPMTQQWGGVYESTSAYYFTYPFTFAEKPWWVVSANESSGGVLSIEAEGSDGSTTRTANFRFTRGTSGSQSITYSCYAFGKWK